MLQKKNLLHMLFGQFKKKSSRGEPILGLAKEELNLKYLGAIFPTSCFPDIAAQSAIICIKRELSIKYKV